MSHCEVRRELTVPPNDAGLCPPTQTSRLAGSVQLDAAGACVDKSLPEKIGIYIREVGD